MRVFNMEVSKKENGAYVKQGEVQVFYPTLDEMGFDVQPKEDDADGFPVYADERVQAVFDSLLAWVKASARNKLQTGTANLKEGNKIAETVEELLATTERNGAALQLRREFFQDLKAFLPSLGKSQAYNAQLYDIISNVKGISAQSEARKALIQSTVGGFAATLDEAKLNAYSRIFAQIEEQIEAASELPD